MFTAHRQTARHGLTAALLAAATLHAATVRAEDIDLFQIDPSATSPPPNVLFLIDNKASWTSSLSGDPLACGLADIGGNKLTKRCLEHKALATLFDSSVAGQYLEKLNIGFMVFSEDNPEGGKITHAVELLDDTYREELEDFFRAGIDDTDQGIQNSNNASYALSMYEAYQYFQGGEPRAGLDTSPGSGTITPDPDAFDGDLYASPGAGACYNYLVVIGNGRPDSGENAGGTPEELLGNLGGRTDTIPLNPDDFESIVADEYSRFFNGADVVPDDIQAGKQTLRTYVIDVRTPEEDQPKDRAAEALMRSVAVQTSQSAYYLVTDPADILSAIEQVLDEIQSVNSVFAATALPVSVNVRGTNLNQVYIGMFRPDPLNKTRWFGNLKLYQLNADINGNVFLADANGVAAQNSQNGFIRDTATSFWTHASTYWDYSPSGDPASESDSPDGAVVEKGGVAQQLREIDDSTSPPDGNADDLQAYRHKRNIYTCTTGCDPGDLLSATPFDTSNGDIPLSDDLINWIRGEDLADEDGDILTIDSRASIHGDVLHSQPAIVNYGGVDMSGNLTEDVVAFYGSNDGMIRAVQGGKETGGEELWAFVPEEFFSKLSDLYDDTDDKTYFADGSFSAYVIDNDGDGVVESGDGDSVYLYTTMRRGGRFMYAFDVTDPDAPELLWHIDSDTAGFAELGQTWSDTRIGKIEDYDDPVVFFGAGYDPTAEDPDPDTGVDDSGSATQGRGLFAINGRTGELLWQVGPAPDTSGTGETVTESDMAYSMPAAPTAIDRDSDGYLDRVYIPDSGGQVWRVNLLNDPDTSEADFDLWQIYKLASVGADQEFQHAVDVVDGSGGNTSLNGAYDAVLVGSGDRENPFDTTVSNRFYMLKDSQTDAAPSGAPFDIDDLFDATDNLVQDGTTGPDGEQATATTALQNADGWYVTLENAGEKVVGSATTLAGTTFFNTNEPPSDIQDCEGSLGTARNYAVNFLNAAATIDQSGTAGLSKEDRSKETPGGGFPPSPVPVVVTINGEQYLAVISGTTVTGVPNIPLGVRERIFWNRENLDQ